MDLRGRWRALLFVTLGSLALVGAGQGESVQVSVYTGGGYLDQVSYRLEQWPILRAESIFILPFATCLFLLGSRLYRAGVFGPEGRALRDRLMWAGLGVGLPLNLLTTTFGNELALVDRYLVPPLVALGFLGLLTRVFEDRPSWLATRFALVGRMSLSCYMPQNAVAMVLCFGWGFGLNSVTTHRPLWTFGVWVLISAIMMVVSTLWLRRFRQGPVEAAWRWAYQARVDTRSMAT